MKRASCLVCAIVGSFAFFPSSASAANGDAAQVTEAIDGVRYTFSPADEPIAHALAPMVAKLKQQADAAAAKPVPTVADIPFGVADLRVHRDEYLRRSAALIGLEQPTALQRECYDGYLDNFASTEQAFAFFIKRMRTLFEVDAISIFRKTDLLRRLKTGEKIPGATLSADGESGSFDFHPSVNGADAEMAALFADRQRRRLDYGYNYRSHDGVVDLSATTRIDPPAKSAATAAVASDPVDWSALRLPSLPVVISSEQETLPPAEIAAKLAEFVADFLHIPQQLEGRPIQTPTALAYLILHETTETGIVERYLGSGDRRWLCEGVANYAAWKIARDRAGDAFARQMIDVPAQLAQFAALRNKVDLRSWPAAEHQRKDDAETPLTRAHYAFATYAVALMVQRHGDDVLARLFQEIGRTPRARANMRTVEQAYRKVAGENLAAVLAGAMAPMPAARTDKIDNRK
jgi:hypothetical protein